MSPHWGYYKGFVRYHLGVVIPDDNAERKCWLRVNTDRDDNARREKGLIERGPKSISSFHAGTRASGNSSTATTLPTRMSTAVNCSHEISAMPAETISDRASACSQARPQK